MNWKVLLEFMKYLITPALRISGGIQRTALNLLTSGKGQQ